MKTKDPAQYEREFIANSNTIREIDDLLEQLEIDQEQLHGLAHLARMLDIRNLYAKKKRLTERNKTLKKRIKYVPLDLSLHFTPEQRLITDEHAYKLDLAHAFWEKQDLLYIEEEIDRLNQRKCELLQIVSTSPTGIADKETQKALNELDRTEASLVLKSHELRLAVETSKPTQVERTFTELQGIRQEMQDHDLERSR